MGAADPAIIEWMAAYVLPHEPWTRRWLLTRGTTVEETDDLIQEAYCRLADLSSTDHIAVPRAYFLSIVQNLRREQFRREKIVRFDALTETLASSIIDERDDPERTVDARRQLALVSSMLGMLPARCREIFRLRRLEGLSQKEISRRMGVSESVVENDAAKAVRHLLATLRRHGEVVEDGEADRRRA